MSILFTGYYGHLNTGDDVFGVISDWGARKYWNEEKIKFFGRDLPKRLDGSKLESSFKINRRFRGQEFLEMIYSGMENSKVLYAGGSIFHSEIKGLSKHSILKKQKELGLVELGAIGVSLGPFKNSKARNSIKNYLSKFSYLALRDKRSYEEAIDMNLSLPVVEAFDLAALLPKIYPLNKINNSTPSVGVSICNYERYVKGDLQNEERRNKKILNTLKILVRKVPDVILKILIFNASERGDMEVSNFLIANLPPKNIQVFHYNSNPYYMWEAINSCNVVLATRLHAGIFSCFSKTPFLQIEYHKKCSDFLKDIEYPEHFRIGDIEPSEVEVCEKLIDLIGLKSPLLNNLKVLEEKAELNFKGLNI